WLWAVGDSEGRPLSCGAAAAAFTRPNTSPKPDDNGGCVGAWAGGAEKSCRRKSP
ncbi:hypothetical protein COCVIDRAFT_100059, partial [Bipolaris victoriae FI3]